MEKRKNSIKKCKDEFKIFKENNSNSKNINITVLKDKFTDLFNLFDADKINFFIYFINLFYFQKMLYDF